MKTKHILLILVVLLSTSFVFLANKNSFSVKKTLTIKNQQDFSKLKDGDIIFQTSLSRQCEAVRIATNSKFSHCGIIYTINNEKVVFEAVQPVKITPLKIWITHGKGNAYLVKRLKNAAIQLTPEILIKMKDYGNEFKNKDYDLYFEWSDDKIYCSELVWKIYKNGASIELCNLAKLKSFNLENPLVKEILKERYGNAIPLEEEVVAPSQLVNSTLLETVVDTY
jgi:uncharacterized protein YycO